MYRDISFYDNYLIKISPPSAVLHYTPEVINHFIWRKQIEGLSDCSRRPLSRFSKASDVMLTIRSIVLIGGRVGAWSDEKH